MMRIHVRDDTEHDELGEPTAIEDCRAPPGFWRFRRHPHADASEDKFFDIGLLSQKED
ncbi:hypothetical protein [Rhizobium phaseoli]|uniref:hypothetical protein n=1 Tax=Rhizobium phaseoli TaxID=396 RepID=UPI0016746640|nr:hypothetical protein [Rhizobium phaseoli]